eukprot:4054517-Prymnesium_polylepis.1
MARTDLRRSPRLASAASLSRCLGSNAFQRAELSLVEVLSANLPFGRRRFHGGHVAPACPSPTAQHFDAQRPSVLVPASDGGRSRDWEDGADKQPP